MGKGSILDSIGGTPLIQLKHIGEGDGVNIFLKLEYLNPGGSIKSRVALHMVNMAEEKGQLKPHSSQTIVEPTGGNTGIGLAIIGAIRGYKIKLVVPDSVSKEKIILLKYYGAEVILSDAKAGHHSHVTKVLDILKRDKEYVFLNQFKNSANPAIHYQTTGKEISSRLKQIDYFVSGIGTGGTISGIGRRLIEDFKNIKIVGVQPKGCSILKGKAIKHAIEGTAIGLIPATLDKSLLDSFITVNEDDVFKMVQILAKNQGIFVGPSSAANVQAAIELGKKLKGNVNIVTVAPDSGQNYLGLYASRGLNNF